MLRWFHVALLSQPWLSSQHFKTHIFCFHKFFWVTLSFSSLHKNEIKFVCVCMYVHLGGSDSLPTVWLSLCLYGNDMIFTHHFFQSFNFIYNKFNFTRFISGTCGKKMKERNFNDITTADSFFLVWCCWCRFQMDCPRDGGTDGRRNIMKLKSKTTNDPPIVDDTVLMKPCSASSLADSNKGMRKRSIMR